MSESTKHELLEISNGYEGLPKEGDFVENGKEYYWNFVDTVVGTVVDRVDRGFNSDMGGYYGSRVHVKAVEEQMMPRGRAVKWEILDGHQEAMKGDPNPNYGKLDSDTSMPNYETYRKMYRE